MLFFLPSFHNSCMIVVDDRGPLVKERLQKYMAHTGLASRRVCEEMIRWQGHGKWPAGRLGSRS